jgi:hypothetical protein
VHEPRSVLPPPATVGGGSNPTIPSNPYHVQHSTKSVSAPILPKPNLLIDISTHPDDLPLGWSYSYGN